MAVASQVTGEEIDDILDEIELNEQKADSDQKTMEDKLANLFSDDKTDIPSIAVDKGNKTDVRDADFLIYGYCHQIQSLFTNTNYKIIPVSIIELCLKFYQLRGIINISLGQCGNHIMASFYQSIVKQNASINNTYFRENKERLKIPRCVAIDLDFTTMHIIKSQKLVDIPSDNYCFGADGCGYNWAKGFYTEGAELIDDAMDILRKEIETFDEPQAIQFMHGISGGTGIYFLFLCILLYKYL